MKYKRNVSLVWVWSWQEYQISFCSPQTRLCRTYFTS